MPISGQMTNTATATTTISNRLAGTPNLKNSMRMKSATTWATVVRMMKDRADAGL